MNIEINVSGTAKISANQTDRPDEAEKTVLNDTISGQEGTASAFDNFTPMPEKEAMAETVNPAVVMPAQNDLSIFNA